ncbi:MAG: DUF934 domain-containing protein [Nitrosomonadales bacterium]|nr:DUF934 domain-containing protein [Nitrosomonadales bacterium]
MLKLIKGDHIAVGQWKTLTLAEGETPHNVRLPAGPVLVPLSVWRARRAELLHSEYEHGWPLGVWLAAEESPEAIKGDLDDFSVVAIKSDSFSDGRSRDAVRLLREHYGFKSELLAAA